MSAKYTTPGVPGSVAASSIRMKLNEPSDSATSFSCRPVYRSTWGIVTNRPLIVSPLAMSFADGSPSPWSSGTHTVKLPRPLIASLKPSAK